MQAGNVGGGDKGNGRRSSARDKMQVSVCDLSSDSFKKTWLTLKELHDKELLRLQGKLTSLRKERLADGRRTGSTAKIKELTEQQKVLNTTITDLRDQLKAKRCDRCSMNETYRNTLQQEFYDIQQRNMKFIAELTAERNKLREENKQLSARLKVNQKQYLRPSFSDSDDDFISCTQKSIPVFSVREPTPGTQVHLPVKLIKRSNTEQMKSGGKKEQEQSSKFPNPFYSQDLFEMPDTPLEKISSNNSKPTTGSSANQKSSADLPLTPTLSPQKGYGLQGDSNLSDDRLGQPQRKPISTQKTSSQKYGTQIDFSWSLSSISTGENPPSQAISATSEENKPDYKRISFPPFTQRKENLPLNIFPFDYTVRSGGKRRSIGMGRYSIGFSVRDSCSQTPSNEQSTLKMTTNESTGAGHGADKPQGKEEMVILVNNTINTQRKKEQSRRKNRAEERTEPEKEPDTIQSRTVVL